MNPRLWHLSCSLPEWRISFSLLCARSRHEEARAGNEEVSQRFGGSRDARQLFYSCLCSEGAGQGQATAKGDGASCR